MLLFGERMTSLQLKRQGAKKYKGFPDSAKIHKLRIRISYVMREKFKKDLIEYIKKNNWVCPKPDKWNELWEMLPGKERVGAGWNPALPLILAAWWDTSESQKNERLIEHINYAEEKGILDQIDKYLRSLSKKQWLNRNEI